MIDLNRLQTTLVTSGLNRKDNPLYQVINQMIQALKDFQAEIEAQVASSASLLNSGPFLLHSPDLPNFPNSKDLQAGNNILFDDSVFGFRNVSTGDWSVLTNGDINYPELIFASGDVIMIYTP